MDALLEHLIIYSKVSFYVDKDSLKEYIFNCKIIKYIFLNLINYLYYVNYDIIWINVY
jgi:hypothetical protein